MIFTTIKSRISFMMYRFVAVTAAAAMFGLTAAHAGNIVTNGGFESGMSGWESVGATIGTPGLVATSSATDINPYQGNAFATIACSSSYCNLIQTLATTAGASYDL